MRSKIIYKTKVEVLAYESVGKNPILSWFNSLSGSGLPCCILFIVAIGWPGTFVSGEPSRSSVLALQFYSLATMMARHSHLESARALLFAS